DAERDQRASNRDSTPAPAGETEADRERNEEQEVENDVGATVLPAHQAKERCLLSDLRGRGNRVEGEAEDGGEAGEGKDSPMTSGGRRGHLTARRAARPADADDGHRSEMPPRPASATPAQRHRSRRPVPSGPPTRRRRLRPRPTTTPGD